MSEVAEIVENYSVPNRLYCHLDITFNLLVDQYEDVLQEFGYPGGNPHEDKIPRYYQLVDELAGRLFKKLPRDVEVLVVSDHGNQAQRGVLAVNQLLVEWGVSAV